jgi:hypothetical protein
MMSDVCDAPDGCDASVCDTDDECKLNDDAAEENK